MDYVEPNAPTALKVAPAPLPAHMANVYNRATEVLDVDQKATVHDLLAEFDDDFAASPGDMGRTSLTRHRIDTCDTPPIRQPARWLPPAKQAEADAAVHEMLQNGVIEPSDSPWSSPVVLMKKKDGGVQFCVDYRRLNFHIRKDS